MITTFLVATLTWGAIQDLAQEEQRPPAAPNDPGILDPVRVELTQLLWRMPATEQVIGDSELVNLVGKVKRKKARGSRSATGAVIQDSRDVTRNVERSLDELNDAAIDNDVGDMRDEARLLRGFVTGQSSGFISDGFPLLHHYQGGFAPDHVSGEYRMKRLTRSDHTFVDEDGATRDYWQVNWSLLWTEAGAESDLALLIVPQDAHPNDRILVHFEVYSSAADDVGLMSFFRDSPTTAADGLPFKGLDTTWVRLREDHVHEFTVDHGAIGILREIGIRGWRVKPESFARADIAHEIFDLRQRKVTLDPRGQALAAAGRAATFDAIGPSAPELKVLQLADAVLAGATPAQVRAAMNQVGSAPYGLWEEWAEGIQDRLVLPREALEELAHEGIVPGADPLSPLGGYDYVAACTNFEWYGLSVTAAGAPFISPIHRDQRLPGAVHSLRVINLDQTEIGVSLHDYGPALHNDLKECYNAPHGGKSLEIFSDKPIWGAPKSDELQWRTGWGFRPGGGVIRQYDLFPRQEDRIGVTHFRDSYGILQSGWQYPADWRGSDFRIDPPQALLGRPGLPAKQRFAEDDGSAGLVIGTLTPGYGTAKMPTSDLSPLHPFGAVNTDTDGDQIDDALIFPSWLKNPDSMGGDIILRTPHWSPFLYLSPQNGTVYIDPANPNAGLWALETHALGDRVHRESGSRIDWIRPRALGQAVWLDLASVRAHGSLPLQIFY